MKSKLLFQPLILVLAIIFGFLLSFIPSISALAEYFEEPLLLVLLFLIFLEVDITSFKKALLNYKFLLTALCINFIVTPAVAILLSNIFLGHDESLKIALILLLVMPCTDWYLVFTDITGGNVGLSSAILPFNLILQFLLLPLILGIAFGFGNILSKMTIDLGVILSVIIPIVIALALKLILASFKGGERFEERLEKHHEGIEFGIIVLIIISIFAADSQSFFELPSEWLRLLIAIICFYVLLFCISFFTARIEGYDFADTVSLVFTTTSRNTPLSLSLASLIFRDNPLVALYLLIGPLTEIPTSLAVSFALKRLKKMFK